MTEPVDSAKATITEESVTLSSEELRRLRRGVGRSSDTELRKKVRWLEYATRGATSPLLRIAEHGEFVTIDVDPVCTARRTFEIPQTTETTIEEKLYECELYHVLFRVREPETVKKVYSVDPPQQGAVRTYVVMTEELATGATNECVVRTSRKSDPTPITTVDFRLYPVLEPEVFDE